MRRLDGEQMMDIDDKRRLVRGLLREVGRGFAEPHGFMVTNNPGRLFQLLCLSVLLSASTDYHTAVTAARSLRDRGWGTAQKLAASPHDRRTEALTQAGHRRKADHLAGLLGELARVLLDRYRGDLRRLRVQAHRDPGRERELLTRLPGVDDQVVDLFFREVQLVWPEVGPFADWRALAAARKLGLGRTVDDLTGLAKSEESERFAWLVGALAQVDLDRRHDEMRALAQ